jgi:putative FmdB family regulatory protein
VPNAPVPEEFEVPTYAYACTQCGHRFDAVQAFSDASLTDCPECSGRLRKLFSAVGIVFKGSGFYRTDSRAQSNGSNGAKPKPESSKSGSDGSGATGKSKELAAASSNSTPNPSSSPSTTT